MVKLLDLVPEEVPAANNTPEKKKVKAAIVAVEEEP